MAGLRALRDMDPWAVCCISFPRVRVCGCCGGKDVEMKGQSFASSGRRCEFDPTDILISMYGGWFLYLVIALRVIM